MDTPVDLDALAPTRHYVPCTDIADRGRTMTTYAEDGRVTVTVPPGELAKLDYRSARELANHLLKLADQARGIASKSTVRRLPATKTQQTREADQAAQVVEFRRR
jgi:hypothetical protein